MSANETNAVAVQEQPKGILARAAEQTKAEWGVRLYQAQKMLDSGLYPRFKTAEEMVIVIAAGESAGFTPHFSASKLYSIQGQVAWQGEAVLAAVYESERVKVAFPVRSAESVTVSMERVNGLGSAEVTWDIARAKALPAQKTRDGTTHPLDKHSAHVREWLTWRAVAECARLVAPDILAGMYTEQELEDHGPMEVDFTSSVKRDPTALLAPTEKSIGLPGAEAIWLEIKATAAEQGLDEVAMRREATAAYEADGRQSLSACSEAQSRVVRDAVARYVEATLSERQEAAEAGYVDAEVTAVDDGLFGGE
jgi:hypothetical protein